MIVEYEKKLMKIQKIKKKIKKTIFLKIFRFRFAV